MKKRIFAVLLVALMAVSITACDGSASNTDSASTDGSTSNTDSASTDDSASVSDFGGTLNVGVSDTLGYFLPGGNNESFVGFFLVYDCVFYHDTDGNVYSDILEDWYYEDETTFVMKLKEGVYFNNGQEATAEDLIFSFTNFEEHSATKFQLFITVDAENSYCEDDYTAVIKFTSEWGPGIFSIDTPLLCKSWAEEVGYDSEDWINVPVGSGPYEVVEYVTDSHYTLQLRDDYWGDETMYNADIETIIVNYYSEISTLFIDLQTGAIDLALNIAETDYARGEEGIENITVEKISTNEVEYFCLDVQNEYLQDENIRLAIAYGVDWSVVADAGFGSLWDPATSLLNSNNKYYESFGTYEYDYDKAMEYIEASGIDPASVTFTFVAMSDDDQKNMAEAFQYYMDQMGFTVDLQFYDFSTTLSIWLEEGGTDFNFQETANGSPSGEPYVSLQALMVGYGSFAVCTIDDDQWNELALAAMSTIDEDERAERFSELQEYTYDHAFVIPLLEGNYAIGYNDTVISSVDFTSGIGANLRNITLS